MTKAPPSKKSEAASRGRIACPGEARVSSVASVAMATRTNAMVTSCRG